MLFCLSNNVKNIIKDMKINIKNNLNNLNPNMFGALTTFFIYLEELSEKDERDVLIYIIKYCRKKIEKVGRYFIIKRLLRTDYDKTLDYRFDIYDYYEYKKLQLTDIENIMEMFHK